MAVVKSTAFIPHGGGPIPLIEKDTPGSIRRFLSELGSLLPQPDAVLVISAHYEEAVSTIVDNPSAELLFDYYGFPGETYHYSYRAPQAQDLLNQLVRTNGFPVTSERGWDHGVFVPLMLMYPDAKIPVLQLSLIKGLDEADHLVLGESLATIASNTLILGSGFSFHNLQTLISGGNESAFERSKAFDDWLIDTVCNPDISRMERKRLLMNWKQEAPFSTYCHPRSEHLLPLFVCVAANDYVAGMVNYSETVMGVRVSGFNW